MRAVAERLDGRRPAAAQRHGGAPGVDGPVVAVQQLVRSDFVATVRDALTATSTPASSLTGKDWSPAFHFAEEAPVQNQRKETTLPSKDALPSYALNWSGAGGAATRNSSASWSAAGPSADRSSVA